MNFFGLSRCKTKAHTIESFFNPFQIPIFDSLKTKTIASPPLKKGMKLRSKQLYIKNNTKIVKRPGVINGVDKNKEFDMFNSDTILTLAYLIMFTLMYITYKFGEYYESNMIKKI